MSKTRIKLVQGSTAVELTLNEKDATYEPGTGNVWDMGEEDGTRGRDVYFANPGPSHDPAERNFFSFFLGAFIVLGERWKKAGHDAKPGEQDTFGHVWLFRAVRVRKGFYQSAGGVGVAKCIGPGSSGFKEAQTISWEGLEIPNGQNTPVGEWNI